MEDACFAVTTSLDICMDASTSCVNVQKRDVGREDSPVAVVSADCCHAVKAGVEEQRESVHQLQNVVFQYNTRSDKGVVPDALPVDSAVSEVSDKVPSDLTLRSPSYLNNGEEGRAEWVDIGQSLENSYMQGWSLAKPMYCENSSFQKSYEHHLANMRLDTCGCALTNDVEHVRNCPNTTFPHKCNMDSEQPLKYDICNESSHNTGREGISDEQPLIYDVCNEANRNTLREGTSDNITEFHACDICFRRFTTLVGVNIHKRVHADCKPFQCEVCWKEFRRSSTLYQHKRSHHTQQTSYTCKACGKVFASQTNLTIHTRVHTGHRPYKCHVCDRAFTQAPALNCHLRIHTDERPFVCDVCGRMFRQPVGLTYHKRTHTGEKPYKCDLCEKAFSQAGPLAYHKRTHARDRTYNCD